MNAIDSLEFSPYFSGVEPNSIWEKFRAWWRRDRGEPQQVPVTDPATYSPCIPDDQLNAYRQLLSDASAIYVFRNGTAVCSPEPMSEADAVEVLKEYGPVRPGTSSADFYIATVESPVTGFVVKYWHPQIISFAPFPIHFPEAAVGSLIRLGRSMDSYDLHVVARYVGKPE